MRSPFFTKQFLQCLFALLMYVPMHAQQKSSSKSFSNKQNNFNKEFKIVITKNTSEEELQRHQKKLKKIYNVALEYEDIFFNTKNELAAIHLSFDDQNGNKGNHNQKNLEKGIVPVELLLKFSQSGEISEISFHTPKSKSGTFKMSNSSYSFSPSTTSNKVSKRKGNFKDGKVLCTITKSSSEEELEQIKNQLKRKGYELTIEDIERDDYHKITAIKLLIEGKNGYKNTYEMMKGNRPKYKGITDVSLIIIKGNPVFTNSKSQKLFYKYLNNGK